MLQRSEYFSRAALLTLWEEIPPEVERSHREGLSAVMAYVHPFIPVSRNQLRAAVVPLHEALRHVFIGRYQRNGNELASLDGPDVLLDDEIGREAVEPHRAETLLGVLARDRSLLSDASVAYYSGTNHILVLPIMFKKALAAGEQQSIPAEVMSTWLYARAIVEALMRQPEPMRQHIRDIENTQVHREAQARMGPFEAPVADIQSGDYHELMQGMAAHVSDYVVRQRHRRFGSISSTLEPSTVIGRGYKRIADLIEAQPAGNAGERLSAATWHVTRYLDEPHQIAMLMTGRDPLRDTGHGRS